MKIYIAHKYEKGKTLNVVPTIKKVITDCGHIPYVFTEEGYIADEKLMMQKALQELEKSDLLIVEASAESIGIGIEAGYFYAKNKPILILQKSEAKQSRTLKGIANNSIVYEDSGDLANELKEYIGSFHASS